MNTPVNNTLHLRGLSEAERNARVNEAVAVHIMGWSYDETLGLWRVERNRLVEARFAMSCDAVIPLLDDCRLVEMLFRDEETKVVLLTRDFKQGVFHELARWQKPLAACITLLRAHGIEVRL